MDVLIFVMLYITFMILILSFSQFTDKIRQVYGRQSIVAIAGFGISLISIVIFLLDPFYSFIGGIVSICIGILGIFHVYLYEEITKGYVISSLSVITGMTIFMMYYLGAAELII